MKPSLSKGTRDFTAQEIYKRRYIITIIQKQFENFGFEPLETPAFENLSTLTGKYGEEGDRLIFNILNSGNFLEKTSNEELKTDLYKQLIPKLSDKALRYDLTVPFARYVAMNHGQLNFPLKRYQIQAVWRADRPQKGRYREFYQCDADVIGTESLFAEIESILLYDAVFSQLKIPSTIHINNRKILAGIAEYADIQHKLIDFTIALDKLDKIGKDKVIGELLSKEISLTSIKKLDSLFNQYNSNEEKFEAISLMLKDSEIGKKGIEELSFILENLEKIKLQSCELKLDITLARGLEYYTGAILEVKAIDMELGSIGGGGRYDNLTEIFGVKNISGMGVSFGLDRLFLVMEQLHLFPTTINNSAQLLFANFSEEESIETLLLIKKLRANDISCELYPENAKLKKQFTYAEKKNIPFMAFYGKSEQVKQHIIIKNIATGEQKTLTFNEIISFLLNDNK